MGRQETCEIPHAPTGAHAGEERRLIKCSRPDGLLPNSSGAERVNDFDTVRSDFDTYFRNLLSNQPLMDREKAVGTTQARFGQLSPVYGSEDWPGEGGGGWAVIRIIGGSATPTAWNTAPEQPGAAARSRSLLPP